MIYEEYARAVRARIRMLYILAFLIVLLVTIIAYLLFSALLSVQQQRQVVIPPSGKIKVLCSVVIVEKKFNSTFIACEVPTHPYPVVWKVNTVLDRKFVYECVAQLKKVGKRYTVVNITNCKRKFKYLK